MIRGRMGQRMTCTRPPIRHPTGWVLLTRTPHPSSGRMGIGHSTSEVSVSVD
jgi:hypothetical protein